MALSILDYEYTTACDYFGRRLNRLTNIIIFSLLGHGSRVILFSLQKVLIENLTEYVSKRAKADRMCKVVLKIYKWLKLTARRWKNYAGIKTHEFYCVKTVHSFWTSCTWFSCRRNIWSIHALRAFSLAVQWFFSLFYKQGQTVFVYTIYGTHPFFHQIS